MFSRTLVLKGSSIPFVERVVRKSFLFRPVVRRFIAGDTLDEALTASESLVSKGLKISLDYLGENTKSEAEALTAKETYVDMLHRISKSPCGAVPMVRDASNGPRNPGQIESTNISIKLTQCGLDQGADFAEENLRQVLKTAQELKTFVRVDMESSEYTQRTMDMISRVWPDYRNTGTVLQSYLYRTPDDIERTIEMQARVRLVKGAYLEQAAVAHQEKAKVDEAYVVQAKRLLDAAFYPAIATQDEKIIRELNRYVADKAIDKSRFEYQMLYGIRRDLQDSLRADGYNVRVYVPFGDSWYPYFTRRLAERPANMFFIAKSFIKG